MDKNAIKLYTIFIEFRLIGFKMSSYNYVHKVIALAKILNFDLHYFILRTTTNNNIYTINIQGARCLTCK